MRVSLLANLQGFLADGIPCRAFKQLGGRQLRKQLLHVVASYNNDWGLHSHSLPKEAECSVQDLQSLQVWNMRWGQAVAQVRPHKPSSAMLLTNYRCSWERTAPAWDGERVQEGD